MSVEPARQSTKAEQELRGYIAKLKEERVNMLPSEPELAKTLGVGRNTLRNAIGLLVDEGLVRRIQGKGSFIVSVPPKITMSGWVTNDPGAVPVIDTMVGNFRALSGTQVEYLSTPFYQYPRRVLQQCLSGNAPDVIQVNPYWLPRFQKLDQLLPLDDVVNQQNISKRYTADVESGRIDGQLYALNWSLCPLVLYYNKQVMERAGLDPSAPPTNFEELTEQAGQVNEAGLNGVHGLGLPLAPNEPHFHWLLPFLLSFGGGFADPIGNVTIDSEANIHAGNWLIELLSVGGTLKPLRTEDVRILFATDRLAFMLDSSYGRGLLRQITGRGKNADAAYGIAKIPVGPSGRSESVLLTHALSISRRSSNLELAYQWIDYLTTNEDNARLYYEEYGMIPCLRDILDRPFYLSDPFASVLIDQVDSASLVPISHPLYSRSLPFIANVFSDMLLNRRDPRERLSLLKEMITVIGRSDDSPATTF